MKLDAYTVTIILSVIIPIATGLLTKAHAHPLLKGAVSLTLAAATGLVSTAVGSGGGAVISQEALRMAALAWVIQLATYLGIYQPAGLNDHLSPGTGLGADQPPGGDR